MAIVTSTVPIATHALVAQLRAGRRQHELRRQLDELRRQLRDLTARVDRWSHLP